MIYLLRHGQTQWNTEGRKQGQGDSPLTPRGLAQVRACAAKLASLTKGDHRLTFHVSRLERARQTAFHLAAPLRQGIRFIFEPALVEMHYGAWEGHTNEEVDRLFPGARKSRNRDRWHHVIPGGESHAMVQKRVVDWLATVDQAQANVVVTHSMVSRIIRGTYLGLGPDEMLGLTHPHTAIFVLDRGDSRCHEAEMEC